MAKAGDLVDQRLQHLDIEHLERGGHPVQQGNQRLQGRGIAILEISGQEVLGLFDFLAERLGHRLHGLGCRHAEILLAHRQQGIECKGAAHLGGMARGGVRLTHLEEHRLDQRLGGIAQQAAIAADGDLLELLLQSRQQPLAIVVNGHGAGRQRVEIAARHPEQLFNERLRRLLLQTLNQRRQFVQVPAVAGVAQPVEQDRLEGRAQRTGRHRVIAFGKPGRGILDLRRTHIEIRLKKVELVERFGAAQGAQLVEQRQETQRCIRLAELQARQVVRQRENAADQGLDNGGVGGELAAQDRLGQRLGFTRQQRGAIQLDHLQGAEHLVQIGRAETQLAFVGGVLGVRLEGETRLLEGLVDLGLDPTESARVNLAERAHIESGTRGEGKGASGGQSLFSAPCPSPLAPVVKPPAT